MRSISLKSSCSDLVFQTASLLNAGTSAVRYLRQRGHIIPSRTIANQPAKLGDLRIEECLDEELQRGVRTATLLHADAGVSKPRRCLSCLTRKIISMSPQAFTLTGFERIEGVEYAQSWLVAVP